MTFLGVAIEADEVEEAAVGVVATISGWLLLLLLFFCEWLLYCAPSSVDADDDVADCDDSCCRVSQSDEVTVTPASAAAADAAATMAMMDDESHLLATNDGWHVFSTIACTLLLLLSDATHLTSRRPTTDVRVFRFRACLAAANMVMERERVRLLEPR